MDHHCPWVNNCVAVGSLVSLADGRRLPIEQVRPGMRVLARLATDHDQQQQRGDCLTGRTVTALVSRGRRECLQLGFSDGRSLTALTCTPDHRILTAAGKWVEAQDLVVGEAEVAAQPEGQIGCDALSLGLLLPLRRLRLVARQAVGERAVCDLSVPSSAGDDSASFVADGVVVHNCVAIFNQKYFVLFLLYTSLCCLYSGCLLVARFVSCSHSVRQCSLSPLQTALCILNFVEALVFGLFCCIMMIDQLTAILDNTPGIDALQHRQGQRKGRYDALRAVFGEPLSLRWLLPLDLPDGIRRDFDSEIAAAADTQPQPQLQHQHAQHERAATLGSALRQGRRGGGGAGRAGAEEERKREESEGKDGVQLQREAAKDRQHDDQAGGGGHEEAGDEHKTEQQQQRQHDLQLRRPHSSSAES